MTAVNPLRRGFAVLAIAALVLSVMAVPAVAAPQKGTAAVSAVDSFASDAVYAGTTNQAFEVTVTNASSDLALLANPVNWIEVDPTSDFTISAAEGPGDWVAEIRDTGRVIFTGGTLGPGSSVTFTVTTNVGRPAGDIDLPWTVTASNDGGSSATSYNPASAGALSPMIRVLQVVGNAFTAPTLILDGDATEGQSVDGEVIIANLGSGTVNVTPSLSGQNFTQNGSFTSFDLAPGQVTVPWSVTLGTGDSTTVTADATGNTVNWGPSDAPVAKSTQPLTVLDAANLSYVEDSLSPTIVGTAEAVTFDVTANFENLGGVSVDPIDLANTTLSVTLAGVTYSAAATGPSAIGPGQAQTFTFSGLSVPAGAIGEVNPVVTIAGTDQNGMAVSQSFTLPDTITFDPTAPTLEIAAVLPTTKVAGEEDAATSGVAFDIEGTVTDNGEPCGACDVAGTLVEYDFSGNELARTVVPLNNDGNGNVSATVEHTFNTLTVEAVVLGAAVDAANLQSNASTARFPVDLKAPEEGSAVTGGPNGQDKRRIDITLSERTAFPQLLKAGDFEVEGNVVTDVTFIDSQDVNNNSETEQGNTDPIGDTIILTLGQDLDEDETPAVHFIKKTVNSRPYDRVGLTLGDFTLEAADGIIPELPSVDSVGGLGEYDDPADSDGARFYTNQNAPTMVVSNVTGGHKISVYEDDGDGVIDAEDRLVGSAEALQDGSVEVQLSDLGLTERSLLLLTQATDGSQNEGLVAADGVTIDLTAPTFSSLSIDTANRTVTVAFSETLRNGRNAVADWVVEKLRFGRYVALERESVSGENGARTITIADSEEQWDGTVNRLTYDFTGSEGERYIDRAGNLLGDFVHDQ